MSHATQWVYLPTHFGHDEAVAASKKPASRRHWATRRAHKTRVYLSYVVQNVKRAKHTVIAQKQLGFLVLVEIRGGHQMSFGALLDGEQPLSGARPVGDDVELVFVADAYAACVRVAAHRRLDQRDDRRLLGDLEFLRKQRNTHGQCGETHPSPTYNYSITMDNHASTDGKYFFTP